jgi:hypothetical protein
MDIADAKIFLCMVAKYLTHLKIQDFFHLSSLQLIHFLFTQIHALGIKNQRNLLLESHSLMNIECIHVFTLWKVHFVEMIKVLLRNTISVRRI